MDREIAAVYQYKNLNNEVIHETVRYTPKSFAQRRPDGKGGYTYNLQGIEPILYDLQGIQKSIYDCKKLFLCEGEKDAINLAKLKFYTTTCAMGAGKWRDSYTQSLIGADVIILPDKDEAGINSAIAIADELYKNHIPVRIIRVPGTGKDVTNWIESGGTRDELIEIVNETPYYMIMPEIGCIEKESTFNLLFMIDLIKKNQFERDFETLQRIFYELKRRSKFDKPYEYTHKCIHMALQERVPVVQLTATLLKCSDKEAIDWLCKMYGIDCHNIPKWRPSIPKE